MRIISKEKLTECLAKSLQRQLDRTGHHLDIAILKAWILASLRKLI